MDREVKDNLLHLRIPAALGPLATRSREHFGEIDRRETELQTRLYEDRGRQEVQRHLEGLSLGIMADPYPLESGLLRYVIASLAVVYRAPPTRYLRRRGERVGDDNVAQQIVWELYARSGVDAVLRHVDELRTLWRTCFVRLYASDVSQRVKLVPYSPAHVLRDPEPGEEDDVRADRQIALRRSDGSWEWWQRIADGYQLRVISEQGQTIVGPETWSTLPIVVFFDGYSSEAFLRPRTSRTSYVLKLAAFANELSAAVKWDVHPRGTFERAADGLRSPMNETISPELGAGTATVLPPGVSFKLQQLNPQIGAISSAMRELVEQWFRAESLPTDGFRQSQSVSALGLQQLAQPLRERRESLAPFVVESERRLFEAFRSLHNLYAPSWDQPWIDETAELEVVLGEVDVPADPLMSTQLLAQKLSLRLIGPIDALMLEHGISREEALRRREQVDADFAAYPFTPPQPEASPADRNMADPDPAETDMNPDASTTQAARSEMMAEAS